MKWGPIAGAHWGRLARCPGSAKFRFGVTSPVVQSGKGCARRHVVPVGAFAFAISVYAGQPRTVARHLPELGVGRPESR